MASWASPQVVLGLEDVAEVAAGDRLSCARRSDGTVWCWGEALSAQDWKAGYRTALPSRVPGLDDAVQITVGGHHACARTTEKTVYCWGYSPYGQAGGPAGDDAWQYVSPRLVGPDHVAEIGAGGHHTCARRDDGTVVCWGNNEACQVGQEATTQSSGPVVVPGIEDAVELTVGDAHSCARRGDGTVVCWGNNNTGQLGQWKPNTHMRYACIATPVPLPGVTDAIEVAASAQHTCVRTDEQVRCWGHLAGDTTDVAIPAVAKLGDVVEMSGRGPICGLRRESGVVCFSVDRKKLRTFDLPDGVPMHGLAVGSQHVCGLRGDDTVACWGHSAALLGGGAVTYVAEPVEVVGLKDAVEITARGWRTCARRRGGEVVCWGGLLDRLPDGGYAPAVHDVPVAVEGIAGAEGIALGDRHGCARLGDGRVRCWSGRPDALAEHPIPGMANLTDVIDLRAGASSTCAWRRDGRVFCSDLTPPCTDPVGAELDRLGPCQDAPPLFPPQLMAPGGGLWGDDDRAQKIRAIDVSGDWRVCVLLDSGEVTCWERGREPWTVPGSRAITDLAGGCAVGEGGTLQCLEGREWKDFGEQDVAQLVGGESVCVLRRSGVVSCWKHGYPPTDEGPRIRGAVQVAAGQQHVCALRQDGTVVCWGGNGLGQLGAGPYPARGMNGVVQAVGEEPAGAEGEPAADEGEPSEGADGRDGDQRCYPYLPRANGSCPTKCRTIEDCAGSRGPADFADNGWPLDCINAKCVPLPPEHVPLD